MASAHQLLASHSDGEITKRRGLTNVVSYKEVNMDEVKTVATYWLLCTWFDTKWPSVRNKVHYIVNTNHYFLPYVGNSYRA